MKILFKIIFIFFTAGNLFCQFTYLGEIGNFISASSFSYNPAGYFYITDAYTNELVKLDTIGNRINEIGGYGWQGASFDNPIDVFSTTLNVYVTDKNNHRIQIFDKDLNFLTQFSNEGEEEEAFRYPLSCCVSSIGDIYILDGENKKVIRYDQNGRFLAQFGSFDSGDFILSDPERLAITSDSKIVVLDKSYLIFFDQYGTGLTKMSIGDNISNINITFNQMVLNSIDRVLLSDLNSLSPGIYEISLPGSEWNDFVEGIITGNKLYLLTAKNILVFKKEKG